MRPINHSVAGVLRGGLLALGTLCLGAAALAESQSFVQTYETAHWQTGLLRFDQDGTDHATATVSYGADSGLIVYCAHETVIALRVDPFYPKGVTPDSNIRFVVKSGESVIYDQTLGPFSFADNSYGGAIPKALAAAMKKGSSLRLTDQTIGLDTPFPLRGSANALSSLKCV